MDFPMAIGAKQFALPKLLSNPIPTPGIPFIRDPEIFIRRFKMMNQ